MPLHPALAAVLVAAAVVDSPYNLIYAAPAGAVDDVFFSRLLSTTFPPPECSMAVQDAMSDPGDLDDLQRRFLGSWSWQPSFDTQGSPNLTECLTYTAPQMYSGGKDSLVQYSFPHILPLISFTKNIVGRVYKPDRGGPGHRLCSLSQAEAPSAHVAVRILW